MLFTPADEHERSLGKNARPSDWTNPTPQGRYTLVAVGGDGAGLVAARNTAALGGRAALLERSLQGSDDRNYGRAASLALLRAARAVRQLSLAGEYGFQLSHAQADFPEIMRRVRSVPAEISPRDAADRLQAEGVDVYFGQAAFTARDRIAVAGRELLFRRAVIATGSRPATPEIPGIDAIECLTNETVFSLAELPRRLIVVGGGPVGCELAQAFRRFGSEVHLVHRGERLLKREEPEASRLLQSQFEREGIHLHLGWATEQAEKVGDAKTLVIERRGEKRKLFADAVLAAVGRRPNVDGLGLEAAGVRFGAAGVEVDDRLRTSNHAVYAVGDVCSACKFTHADDAVAALCLRNALFHGRNRVSRLVIPRCTCTSPQIAQVGLTAAEADERGIAIDSYRANQSEVDRTGIDAEDQGFVLVHTRRGAGRAIGATIVADHAGEMIGEVALLLARGLSLSELASTIHCYSTQAEALKGVADDYSRRRRTPFAAALARRWLEWWR